MTPLPPCSLPAVFSDPGRGTAAAELILDPGARHVHRLETGAAVVGAFGYWSTVAYCVACVDCEHGFADNIEYPSDPPGHSILLY